VGDDGGSRLRCAAWVSAPAASDERLDSLCSVFRGFARRDAGDLERIVMRMTEHEIDSESGWVRLGRAMGPGLYAISVIAGAPPQRAAMLAAYGSSDCRARRWRRRQEGVTR
jgi:hypothetical protein